MLQFNASYIGCRNEFEACINVPVLKYFVPVSGPELEQQRIGSNLLFHSSDFEAIRNL